MSLEPGARAALASLRASRRKARLAALAAPWRAFGRVVLREVDADVVGLGLALALLAAGLWPDLGWRALAVPGAVLLWLVLPSREPFVIRKEPPPAEGQAARRKT